MKRYIVLAIVGFLLIGVLLLVVAVPLGVKVFSQIPAESFLKDVAAIRPGTPRFEDAQWLARKYGGRSQNLAGVAQPCSAQRCQLIFRFANNGVNFLPGAEDISFGAQIIVQDGRIVDYMVIYVIYERRRSGPAGTPANARGPQSSGVDSKARAAYVYSIFDAVNRQESEYGVRRSQIDSDGIPHLLSFRLGPLSTAEDRRRAYSIDLSCLAKWHGCDGPSAVYPAGWESLQ